MVPSSAGCPSPLISLSHWVIKRPGPSNISAISRTHTRLVVERRVSQFFLTTMETSFAITGKGYLIMAADTTAARSIVKMKIDEDKIKTLSPHLLMAYSGEPGTSILQLNLSYKTNRLNQVTPFSLLNTSSVTFAFTKSATFTLFDQLLPLRGFAGHSPSLCDRASRIPSTSYWVGTTQRRTTHISTGSITSVRWRKCLSQPTVTDPTLL